MVLATFQPAANVDAPRPGASVIMALPRQYAYGEEIAPHRHARAQLLHAVEGMMRVRTELGVWILPPKRALLIAPGVTHEITMLSKVSMRSIYMDAAAAAHFGGGVRVLEVSRLLRELILALAAEPEPPAELGRVGHLESLILSEIGAAATVPIAIPWPRDRRLVAVCSAILEAPALRRSIDDWAAEVGASGRTLIRLFPKETGLHYRQWLQQVHLADAFCRLERGESVGDIARALGYASPSAFTAMFRRILGRTPQHYLTDWHGHAD